MAKLTIFSPEISRMFKIFTDLNPQFSMPIWFHNFSKQKSKISQFRIKLVKTGFLGFDEVYLGFGFTSAGTHDSHFVVFSAGGGETPGHGGQRTLKSGHHFWVLFKEFSNFHVWHKTFGFFGKYGDQHINRVTFTSYSYLTQKIDEKCQNVKFISRSNLEFW